MEGISAVSKYSSDSLYFALVRSPLAQLMGLDEIFCNEKCAGNAKGEISVHEEQGAWRWLVNRLYEAQLIAKPLLQVFQTLLLNLSHASCSITACAPNLSTAQKKLKQVKHNVHTMNNH